MLDGFHFCTAAKSTAVLRAAS
jgi:hypothetical protein